MKMTKARFLILITLTLASFFPTPAYAHAGWWDWLDALSGPGPFNQLRPLFDVRVACAFDGERVYDAAPPDGWIPIWYKVPKVEPSGHDRYPCLFSSDQARRYIEVRVGWISSAEHALFGDRPTEFIGTVTAHQLQVFYMTQLHPSFAIGPGAGLLWFSGQAANGQPQNVTEHPSKVVLTPLSGSFRPFRLYSDRRWANFVSLRAEGILVPGFDKDDFNKSSTSTFRSSPELLGSVAITFDVSAFLPW